MCSIIDRSLSWSSSCARHHALPSALWWDVNRLYLIGQHARLELLGLSKAVPVVICRIYCLVEWHILVRYRLKLEKVGLILKHSKVHEVVTVGIWVAQFCLLPCTFLRAEGIIISLAVVIVFQILVLLLDADFAVAEVIRGGVRYILHRSWVKLFGHDVQRVPHFLIIALLESVEFAVVGAPISIYFWIFVCLENASHWPLTIDKAAVSHDQKLWSSTAWTSQDTICHFLLHLEDLITPIDDDEFLEGRASCWHLVLQLWQV